MVYSEEGTQSGLVMFIAAAYDDLQELPAAFEAWTGGFSGDDMVMESVPVSWTISDGRTWHRCAQSVPSGEGIVACMGRAWPLWRSRGLGRFCGTGSKPAPLLCNRELPAASCHDRALTVRVLEACIAHVY